MEALGGFRFDVPSRELLSRLAADALPLGLRAGPLESSFHRDVYFDTADEALARRGFTCRLRYRFDDRRLLALGMRGLADGVVIRPDVVVEAAVAEVDPAAVFAGASEPARRLRGLVDPARLQPVVAVETERRRRIARIGWLFAARFEFWYDHSVVALGSRSRSYQELGFRRSGAGRLGRGGREGRGGGGGGGGGPRGPSPEALVRAFQDGHALRPVLLEPLDRARQLLRALESETLAADVRAGRAVALLVVERQRIALHRDGGALRLPVVEGSGEGPCRALLQSTFGSGGGPVELLGTAAASGARPAIEVWLARRQEGPAGATEGDGVEWLPLEEVIARVGSPALRDGATLAALTVAARSDLMPEWRAAAAGPRPEPVRQRTSQRLRRPVLDDQALDPARPAPEQFINVELSAIEFNARVLELAEDARAPLLERVRFLSIFRSNFDEFFMVRVGALKQAVAEGRSDVSADGLTPQEQLDAISIRVRQLLGRQARCLAEGCLPALAEHGLPVRRWAELGAGEQDGLRRYFADAVFPVLSPRAITVSPGHPFPHIRNLALSLALLVRDPGTAAPHFVHLTVPLDLPRYVPTGQGALVSIEEVIRANLAPLYPGRGVEQAHAFRVTRSGDVHVDERGGADLLAVVSEEVRRRPFQAVVRLEVERAMPPEVRELLLRELRMEKESRGSALTSADVYEMDAPLDPAALRQIADLPRPDLCYAPFRGRPVLPAERPVFSVLAEGDVLVHHPHDAFEDSVERFFREAAGDPDVQSIKLTLYRAGGRSSIVDALVRAAQAGKDVAVFVEVKARFDEARNIEWARKLEAAGIHVVYGLVALKTHAKVALVIRREGRSVRRYVHVGTGNYNAATAAVYTDLGLLSADPDLGADLTDLFNELTGSTQAPQAAYRRILVAPTFLLPRMLELIEREAAHARAGRGGRIRAKLNGLADTAVIGALYRASQAGVDVELIVRGVCALRPGVPGLSEHIRVVSILGRFLEHARIFAFDNDGEPEYYIGSADWRPRNLRARVEVIAPVRDPKCRARLEQIVTRELAAEDAWELGPDGAYVRRSSPETPDRPTA